MQLPLHTQRLCEPVRTDPLCQKAGTQRCHSETAADHPAVRAPSDPVGSYGKAVRQVYQNWKQQGIADVSCKLYPTDRHEILNETDRDVVYADIAAWLERHL